MKSKPVAQPTTTALDFCLCLSYTHALLTRRLDNALASLHGLSFGDFAVLGHLSRAPDTKLRRIDLAERMGLTASGVTRTLLPLEKLGLVSREADARDARVAHACLTKAGQRLLAHATTTAAQVSENMLQAASGTQIDDFARLLGRIAALR